MVQISQDGSSKQVYIDLYVEGKIRVGGDISLFHDIHLEVRLESVSSLLSKVHTRGFVS